MLSFAVAGMLALAVAMGIGRFAFTPVLPMMMQDRGLSLVDGGWLASANYLGYLVGALAARWIAGHEERTIGIGLLVISAVTMAMAIPLPLPAMLALRFVAGVSSALVLVCVSAWSLAILASRQRSVLNGVVFAGVGTGIAGAGIACLILTSRNAGSGAAWLLLGAFSLLVLVLHWQYFFGPTHAAVAAVSIRPPAGASQLPAHTSRLVWCYGAYGFGYIIPATFLPVMARQSLDDPGMVGFAWPLFGLAAMGSTLVGPWLLRRWSSRDLWIRCHWLMAAGIVLTAFRGTAATVLVAALLVGGTFMLITLCAMQEARRIAGAQATPLMAGMTAAFAVGQIAGPLLVSAGSVQAAIFRPVCCWPPARWRSAPLHWRAMVA